MKRISSSTPLATSRLTVSRETPRRRAASPLLTRTFDAVCCVMRTLIGDRSGKVTRVARRSPKWYAWALRLGEPRFDGYIAARRHWLWTNGQKGVAADVGWPRVLRGLDLARELATLAERRRGRQLLSGRDPRSWLNDEQPLSPVERFGGQLPRVTRDIAFARRALFGEISDRAVRHRLQRFAAQTRREPRYCSIVGCENELPRTARSTRKRCDACRDAGRRTARASALEP